MSDDARKPTATAERYENALRLTAPKAASVTCGLAVDGYWLENNRYFFLHERFEPKLDRVVSIPSIADCQTQQVEEVISLNGLEGLISERCGAPVNWDELSVADFDIPNCDTLGVAVGGHDYLIDFRQRRIVQATPSLGLPALYSPNGRFAAFVKGHDIWVSDRHTEEARRLTTDGAVHYSYGQQTQVCSSPITNRKSTTPVGLWSPDSQWFFTHQIDERRMREMALIQHAPPGNEPPILHSYKYSIPGDPLPAATYIAIHVASGRVVRFDEFQVSVSGYSPFSWRLVWFDGGNSVWFVRFDRYFKSVDLVCLDLLKGTGRVVLSEEVAAGYVELNAMHTATPNVRIVRNSTDIVWFSERDGWGHLYLYNAESGVLKNRITGGEWVVRDIVHVDEKAGKIVFTACGIDPHQDPARRSLCSVNFDGRGFEVLITHDGDIALPRTEPAGLAQDRPFCPSYAQSGVSPDGRFGVVRFSSVERGNRTEIIELHTRQSFHVISVAAPEWKARPLPFAALAADGATRLHGVLLFPSDFDPLKRYPLIDYIYPGPQITQRPQAFGPNCSFSGALAELGFVILMLDTRGLPFRSRALHQIGYGELLEPQLADHAAVVRQLIERHSFLDGERIGAIGYSGGGLATARALFDYGHIFKVGVAVCGNHDSSLYTSFWSDKYRGPGARDGWTRQANSAAAHKLSGKLLLMSGDLDENVHVSQTLCLANALIRANRDFDLLIVPNEGHMVLMASGYAHRRAWDFFVLHLLGQSPPANFEIKFEPHEVKRMEKSLIRELLS